MAFVDSNLFLYAFSDLDLEKQAIAAKIISQKHTISIQVINEVSNNLLKKFHFNNQDVQSFALSCYGRYNIVSLNQETFVKACMVRDRYCLSYYDSLIISSALQNNCNIIYSEDMQHNQIIENRLTIINPFLGKNP